MRFGLILFLVEIVSVKLISSSDLIKCGVKWKSNVDKTTTEANEWPWVASLFFKTLNNFKCGGSIVSDHHIITAAHCVSRRKKVLDPSELLVYLGKHNLSASEENSEWFHPHEILVHPDWEEGDKKFDADLAILVSAIAFPFSEKISPVCLWTDVGEDEDNIGTVVGWGGSKDSIPSGHSDVPHQFQVERVPSARCYEDFYLIASIASSRTFCAGGVVKDFNPCTGDSGGGFFMEQNGVWFIQGILSATFLSKRNRCDITKYALYTKINEFLTWISITNKEQRVGIQCNYVSEIKTVSSKVKVIPRCEIFGLSVVQPSRTMELSERRLLSPVESMVFSQQDMIYLPNGIGDFFKRLNFLQIIKSRLKFVEKRSFENLGDLFELRIEANPITHIPGDAFSPLTRLEFLEITSCKLTKLSRDLLTKNALLRFLNISDNHLDSLPADFLQNNIMLEYFDVSNNRIRFIDRQSFSNLRSLTYINFKGNFIQEINRNAFNDLTNVHFIGLSINRLKSLHVDTFANNSALEFIHVQFNEINEFKAGLFRNNLRLKSIALDGNKVKTIHSKFVDNLVNLKRINLSGMSISELPFDLFFTLKSYELFVVDDNELQTLHKDLLSKNQNLVYFGASYNNIESLDPNFFRNNIKLREIYLTNNRIKTVDEELFRNLENIVKIVLSFNNIDSIVSGTFSTATKLRELHLQGNNLGILSEDLFKHNLQLSTLHVDLRKLSPHIGGTSKIKRPPDTDFAYKNSTKVDLNKCGLKLNASGLIVGGKATEDNDWPWLTSLFKTASKEFFCGGSIVSDHHVLTAAHCINDKKRKTRLGPRDILVHLGKHNLSSIRENSADWFIPHDILVHPDWESDIDRWDADLAILVADAPFQFTNTMMPVCLWTELEEDNNYNGIVVGWGASEGTRRQGHTDIPYRVDVRRVPSEKCYQDFHKIAKVASSRTFCAGGVQENTGPCNGDSGGGFFVEDNGVWYLQGIVSSSMVSQVHDCDVSKHALYTKINEFISWINLKNKAYDVVVRGKLLTTPKYSEEIVSIYQCKGLTVTQPAGQVVLRKKFDTKVDIVEIKNLKVVYLPNGLGRVFADMRILEVFDSKLRFIERENFKDMENLEALRFHSNPISNIPGDAFSDLTNLHALRISETNLVQLNRNLLAGNPRLKHLFLSSNQIETLPLDLLRNNSELLLLDLSQNRFKSIDNQVFRNLKDLNWCYLTSNVIQDIAPDAFSGLTSLKGINLQRNRLKSLHEDSFAANKELLKLWIGYNKIKILPQGLVMNNLKLDELAVSFNKFEVISSSMFEGLGDLKLVQMSGMNLKNLSVGFLSSLTNLEELRIEDNELSYLHKDCLSKNLNLRKLLASNNKIEDLAASLFKNSSNLETITLAYNKLKVINFGLFQNLLNLENLFLDFNFIGNIHVDTFSDLTKLKILSLKGNKLAALNENLFIHVKNLKVLAMDSNQIEHLPAGLFRENPSLLIISFSFNRIQRMDTVFNINQPYIELNFFGNICVSGLGRDGTQTALILEIQEKCIARI